MIKTIETVYGYIWLNFDLVLVYVVLESFRAIFFKTWYDGTFV